MTDSTGKSTQDRGYLEKGVDFSSWMFRPIGQEDGLFDDTANQHDTPASANVAGTTPVTGVRQKEQVGTIYW